MKGESQKRDVTSSLKVVICRVEAVGKTQRTKLATGTNGSTQTRRPYSKFIQNLRQKSDLEMTLHQAISHLIQETAAKFKGTFCDWS